MSLYVRKRGYIITLMFLIVVFLLSTTYCYGLCEKEFVDLREDEYYYTAIMKLANAGYIDGYSDSTVRAGKSVSKAEALTLLFNVTGVEREEPEGEIWCYGTLEKAKELGIFEEVENYNQPADRLTIAKYIIAICDLNTDETFVHDVFADTNALEANTMYQYNIFVGSQKGNSRVFNPYSNIKRGDLCIVLNRLLESEMEFDSSVADYGGHYVQSNPEDYLDFIDIFKYMYENNLTEALLEYDSDIVGTNTYDTIKTNIKNAYSYSYLAHPEYFAFSPTITLKRTRYRQEDVYVKTDIRIVLSNQNYTDEEIVNQKEVFYAGCKDIYNKLVEEEKLNAMKTDLDKISVIFNYVCNNLSYDKDFQVVSYTGYGGIVNGKVTCQGYTGIFNQLCLLAGYDVGSLTGYVSQYKERDKDMSYHIISKVKVNGEWRYFDTTFADSTKAKAINYDYFNMSLADVEKYIEVNKEIFD